MDNFTLNKMNQTIQYDNGNWNSLQQLAPDEIAVDLSVNGQFWLTFMCSPFQIEQLAIGFLFNEHIISSKQDLTHISVCEDLKNVDVWLNFSVKRPENWIKTSGCLGGQTTNRNIIEPINWENEIICPQIILDQMQKLLFSQDQYQKTRGIHCSLMTDAENLSISAEDIGRHNTLDKLAGQFLLAENKWKRKLILTTGRISSEMIQKAAHIGAGVLASRTSPTQSSIRTASNLNLTLIGYVRRHQFTIYSHPERIENRIEIAQDISVLC